MALIIGIDEAGYGPLLGPLVVSAVALSVPDELVEADFWMVLSRSITRSARSSRGRVVINDSKTVFKPRQGLGMLQRSVLSVLCAWKVRSKTLAQLLSALDPECIFRLRSYPWHQALDQQYISADWPDLELAGSILQRDMSANGVALVMIAVRCIDVVYYNNLMERLRNKATVLFCQTCGLMHQVVTSTDQAHIVCLVDRQGGRVQYRAQLQTMFPDCGMTVVHEDQQSSIYQLSWPGRRLEVRFIVDADSRHMPTALASMVSKYVRELLMDQMNRYLASLSPGLRPTCGYWQDGMRFLRELAEKGADVDRSLLVRSR